VFSKATILSSLLCSLLLGCLFARDAVAGDPSDRARVIVEGRILDTPCTIDPGSQEQTIRMGATPVGIIARDGAGQPVPFTVRLRDCVLQRFDRRLPDWQGLSITFDGVSDGEDFAANGAAGGVALRISDADGHRAVPGKPLPGMQLVQGDQALAFTLQLVSNHRPLVKGEYHAVIHFGISYF